MIVDEDVLAVSRDETIPVGVVRWLGGVVLTGMGLRTHRSTSRGDLNSQRRLLLLGTECLMDWPRRFERMLSEQLLARSDGQPRLLAESFPRWRLQIRALPSPLWRDRILAVLSNVVQGSAARGAALISRSPELARTGLSRKSVALQLGMRPEGVLPLTKQQTLSVQVRSTKGGRQRVVLTEQDLASLSAARYDRMTVMEATCLLGLSAERVRCLVQTGMFRRENGFLSRREVAAFMTSVRQRCRPLLGSPAGLVEIRHHLRGGVPVPVTGQFLQGLLDQEGLQLYGDLDSGGLAGLRMQREALRKVGKRRADAADPWLTLPQASERLGFKEEVVYQLAHSGWLPTRLVRAGARRARHVKLSILERFQSSCVPLARLVRAARIAPKHGFDWALTQGLNVVTGPRVDGCRQYFVLLPEDTKPPATPKAPVRAFDSQARRKLEGGQS